MENLFLTVLALILSAIGFSAYSAFNKNKSTTEEEEGIKISKKLEKIEANATKRIEKAKEKAKKEKEKIREEIKHESNTAIVDRFYDAFSKPPGHGRE